MVHLRAVGPGELAQVVVYNLAEHQAVQLGFEAIINTWDNRYDLADERFWMLTDDPAMITTDALVRLSIMMNGKDPDFNTIGIIPQAGIDDYDGQAHSVGLFTFYRHTSRILLNQQLTIDNYVRTINGELAALKSPLKLPLTP